MQEVCEGGAVSTGQDGHLQCDICPSYTDSPGQSQAFGLEAIYRGHFFKKDADQLVVVLGGVNLMSAVSEGPSCWNKTARPGKTWAI